MKKVIHLCHEEKFLPAFVELIRSNFPNEQHHFVVMKQGNGFDIGEFSNITYVEGREQKLSNRLFLIIKLLKIVKNFDKVIFHSLFKVQYIQLLFLLRNTEIEKIWFIWGGDLYQNLNSNRKNIRGMLFYHSVRSLNSCITQIVGDKNLVEKKFSCKLKHYNSFFYPSNLVSRTEMSEDDTKRPVTILLGNSACKNNNHLDVIKKIKNIDDGLLEVICPLSYGDSVYAQEVIYHGGNCFGERFKPLINFLAKQEYDSILERVDVAIFPHERQQAFGNIISLLEKGKKVYVSPRTTHYKTLKDLGFNLFSIEDIHLVEMPIDKKLENKELAIDLFSMENLMIQLSDIFHS